MIADPGREKVAKLTKFIQQVTVANIPDDKEIAIKGDELASFKLSGSSTSNIYYVVGQEDPVQELRAEMDAQRVDFEAKLDAQRTEFDAKLDAQKVEFESLITKSKVEDMKRIVRIEEAIIGFKKQRSNTLNQILHMS